MDNSAISLQYRDGERESKLRTPDHFRVIHLARHVLSVDGASPANEDLARAIGYSASQVRRFAGQVLGEPLSSFARRLKLERAAGRLCAGGVSVNEAGTKEGYDTLSAFSKSFFAWFGSAPSEFRVLNASNGRLLPGYLLSNGGADKIPNHVQLLTRDGSSVCLMYAGPILLGRRLPDGVIELGSDHFGSNEVVNV